MFCLLWVFFFFFLQIFQAFLFVYFLIGVLFTFMDSWNRNFRSKDFLHMSGLLNLRMLLVRTLTSYRKLLLSIGIFSVPVCIQLHTYKLIIRINPSNCRIWRSVSQSVSQSVGAPVGWSEPRTRQGLTKIIVLFLWDQHANNDEVMVIIYLLRS